MKKSSIAALAILIVFLLLAAVNGNHGGASATGATPGSTIIAQADSSAPAASHRNLFPFLLLENIYQNTLGVEPEPVVEEEPEPTAPDPIDNFDSSIPEHVRRNMVLIDPDKPLVALTFDDGPCDYTSQILDILKQYNSRATFFVVGNRVSSYVEAMQKIVDQGSEVGNHSWSHPYLTNLSYRQIREQIIWTNDIVQEVTGIRPLLVRPPYGAVSDQTNATIGEIGMPLITWSIDTKDWQTRNATSTYNSILGNVTNGSIILCHDIHAATLEAMYTVIPALVEKGYQLVTVSELLYYKYGAITPGAIYRNAY